VSATELVCRVSNLVGRSPGARLAASTLVTAFRSLHVAESFVQSATAAIADGGRAGTLPVAVTLPNGAPLLIVCDLRYEACRQVALRPGWLERNPELRLFSVLAARSRLVIDAGANAGFFSYVAAAASPDVRVIAIEPIPALAALLRDNAAANRLAGRIDVHELLISDGIGTGRLFIARSDSESTMQPERAARQVVRRSLDLPTCTLDALLDDAAAEPSATLIKIDVEGHERQAIGGLARTLGSGQRPELFVEFLGDALSAGIIEQTIARGYDVYYVCGERLLLLGSTSAFLAHQNLNYWNFLCSVRSRETLRDDGESAGLEVLTA
jgi:FkbM family methyltransferase